MRRLLVLIVLVVIASGGAAFWWLHQPLVLGGDALELAIEPGTTPRGVPRDVVTAGAQTDARLLYAWFRFSGQDRAIKAGNYEIPPGTTPRSLLQKLVRGEESLRAITLVEGWNWRQVRQALAREDQLKRDSTNLTDEALMAQLGRPGVHPEGRFFPDTYTYAKGSSDIALLRRALHSMDRRLEAAWAQRAADTPLKSAAEALILASIVEKETGRASDRAQIAGVFANRLRIGMLLQTDPTVIYGLGDKFDGNLRRRDLLTDTPWNTYTRGGLPPTPISMPGKASLVAAVQPEATRALYFVAKGDGTSHFSASLEEHNRAVNRYQRGQCRHVAHLSRPSGHCLHTYHPLQPKVFMSRPGLFISFEGIDGAGKSSHIEGLATAFRAQGRAVTVSREPGGTPLAEKLREMVLNDPMDALTESLLIFAARRDHLRNVIEPALARGDVVLCDRFTDATFAYQGAGRGFDLEVLSTLEQLAQTGLALDPDLMREPDLTVWFDLAPEVAAQRLAGARVPDRFEAQPVEFFRRVAQGYADRASAAPQRFARLDAAQDRHRVWQQLTSVFVRKGWLAIMVASQGGPQ